MRAEDALALAKSYVKKSLAGAGAIKGDKGDPGNDGFSPIVSIDKFGSETTISITDATHQETAKVLDGVDGKDGETPVVTIGGNGNWFINGVDTLVSAKGAKGDTGSGFSVTKTYASVEEMVADTAPANESEVVVVITGDFGNFYLRLASYVDPTGETDGYLPIGSASDISAIKGEKGNDGITPRIDHASKHWFIGDTDTGTVAEGKDGTTYTPTIGTITTVDNSNLASASVEVDEDKKVAKFNFSIPKGKDGKDGNGSSAVIDVDTEMSDTSENAVQNKVIKKYVDEKSVNISADDNNAIKSNEDGIYVKDLSNEVNNISYAQKTVNKKLDYCYLQAEQTYISFKAGMVVPFNILSDSNNVETNSTNNSVKLKANKTYKISCDMFVDQAGYCYIELYDLTNDIVLAGFSKAPSSYNTTSSDSSLQYIYTPKENCEIQIKVKTVNGTIRMYNTLNTAYFIVEEIGQAVTIDPLEYVNESQGIEDTPVGHIIAHMGTTAPKHYLICDGSSVAVADYPYLAQHFKDSFGSEYYFGGSDGTMNLPDLRGEFLRGTGTNSHAEQGNGGTVGEHQDATEDLVIWRGVGGGVNANNSYDGTFNSVKNTDSTSGDCGTTYASFTVARNNLSGGNLTGQTENGILGKENYTSRPTNTSVLYCIKYEPTYFMQNTYNGNVYSMDEQIVGRWIDGKPIYQKIIEATVPEVTGDAVSAYSDISFDENGQLNVEKIISITGYIESKTTITPLPWYWNSGGSTLNVFYARLYYVKDNGYLRIDTNSASASGNTVVAAIQYTKTTD